MNNILEVDGVTSGYGTSMIVREFNLNVRKGEVYALIGRNGVGKSTLVKTIMGLIRARSGHIRFSDTDVTRSSALKRAHCGMGYVPQGRGIFQRLSVAENLEIGASIGGKQSRQEVAENIEHVKSLFPRLRERASQRAGSLSGGEQQQLAIGRVLAGNPSIILLDEPSDGIQPNIIEQIAEIILQIKAERGLTILLVEQHLGLISAVANRCGVVDHGRIVAEISPEEISDPQVAKEYLAI